MTTCRSENRNSQPEKPLTRKGICEWCYDFFNVTKLYVKRGCTVYLCDECGEKVTSAAIVAVGKEDS